MVLRIFKHIVTQHAVIGSIHCSIILYFSFKLTVVELESIDNTHFYLNAHLRILVVDYETKKNKQMCKYEIKNV